MGTPFSFLPGDPEATSEEMLCPAPCSPGPQAPELVLSPVTTQRHNTYLLTFGPRRPERSPDAFVSLQANTRRELRGFEDTGETNDNRGSITGSHPLLAPPDDTLSILCPE